MAQDSASSASLSRALGDATLNQLLDAAPDALVVVDLDGVIQRVNTQAERLFGYARAELLGQSVDMLAPEALRAAHRAERRAYAAHPQARPMDAGLDLTARRADGSEVQVEISLSPITAVGQQLVVASVRDVTERRRVEERLRRSEARLAEAQKIAHIGAWEWDIATGTLLWSDELCRIYGVDPAGYTPRFTDFLQFVHPDDRERVAAIVAQAEEDHQPYEFFHRAVRADGSVRYMHAHGEVELDANGAPVRMFGTGQDITEVREAHERDAQLERERAARAAAEAAQRRLALLAEASVALAAPLDWEASLAALGELIVPDLADLCVVDLLYDPAIRPVVVNARDPRIAELSREMRRLYPLDLSSAEPVARVARGGEALLFPVVTDEFQRSLARDERHAELLLALNYRSAIVVPLSARGLTLGTLLLARHDPARPFDEDDRVLVEELARRAALAVDNARLFTAEQVARREAELTSERVSRLLAITAAFSRARTPLEVEEAVVAVAARTLGATAGAVYLLNESGLGLDLVGSHGLATPFVERWARLPLDAPLPAAEAARTGQPVWLEDPAERRVRYPELLEASTSVTLSSAALPLSVDERVIGTLNLGFSERRDFSEADRAFMQALAQQCAQALERARLAAAERAAQAAAEEALAAREVFLSIAAHELKTPLTSIKAAAHLLDRRLVVEGVEDERIFKVSGQLRSEIERLERLVSDLLDVSRIQRGQLQLRRESLDLAEMAAEIVARFEDAVERTAAHTLTLDAPEPTVGDWDPARLDQVLTNLLSNALKYSPAGGAVTVRVARTNGDALLTVSDEGIGITPAEQARLFQPFMRGDAARQTSGGTGLGLFIAAEIVARHGGTLTAVSEPGRGSAFTARLPRVAPE